VLDALTVAEQSGHTWQYAWQLEALAARALGSRLPIEAALARLVEDETVVAFGSHFFLKETYIAERGIVKEIQRLVETGDPLPDFAVAAGAGGIVYSEQQRQAILRVLAEPVCVLTGGAGTGKSTVVRGIVEQYAAMYPNRTIITAAPTGKAAHRLTETTGREATTVHRMLGYVPLGSRFVPSRKKNAPLDCDFLIVDEASMLTVEMMYRVLCALEDGTKLLIVGDTQQLSAIGAGAVLRDLQSILPVAKLTEVFRQGEHSNIVQVARQVAQGEMPDFGRDCVFVECQNDLEVKEQTLKLVQKAVESGWTKDTLQVLVPRRTGDYGVEALNPPLQAYLNPNGSPAMETKRFHYRIGDKVIQRVNDYAREIVNGDLGTVEDFHGGRVFVRFSETDVISYAPYEMGQLQPAYACTVHQYQGSQAPLVILPLAENHGRMLHRNLFYTGVTRAESQCFVVGTKKALQQAVEGMEAKRQTALCRFDALLSEKEGAW
jgi:exodeoxyribonuclease V alpha subunit